MRRAQEASNASDNTTQVNAPPAVTASDASQSTSTAIVDQVLSQLTLGDVAFNSPTVINIEETVSIRVALSPNQGRAAVSERITEPGTVMAESLQISNMMEARLTGEGFKIVAVTAERQAVSSGITEWIWDITPVAEGKQQLTLTMDALITVNGALVPKTLRTFRKPIEVEVTTVQRAGALLGEHGKWAWSTLLLPLWAWLSRRKKAKKASVTESK